MNEQNTNTDQTPEEVPQATVKARSRRYSIVWIVPIVALIIGAWLVYKAYSEKGPVVTITFKTAEGLEAGKTKIKYKDVEIGVVEEIQLSEDLSHVVLKAELVKGSERFLTEKTRFWVVRARVAAGEVSGLGTLFSGAYIGLDPGKSGEPRRDFEGLEIPPVVTTDLPGGHYTLRGSSLGSIDVGSPVYYRRIKVGQVVSYKLEKDGQAVTVDVFINDPYHQLVYNNTRFWNASGLDVEADASGIRVNTQSLVTLMVGGVAFDTPANLETGDPAQDGDVFKLYETRSDIFEKTYARKARYLLHFDGSVRGLEIGAPVEFRGIHLGQVVDVNLVFSTEKRDFRIPVLIETEPERLLADGNVPAEGERRDFMDYMVKHGLRAQLKTGNLITGQLFVDLDMHPEAPPAAIKWEGRYPELPTLPTTMQEITTSLAELLNKVEKLPIEQIGRDLRETTRGASRIVNSDELKEALTALNNTAQQVEQMTGQLNKTLTPQAETAIKQLNLTLIKAQRTLEDISGAVNTDSALYGELKRTLTELADAARSIRVMADYLERHPDALIKGKGTGQ
jgi:paraquat-inducible protein B